MENQKLDKITLIALILAIIAFLLAASAVLIKYFRHGEFDVSTLAGGIVIPAIVIALVMSTRTKK